MLEQRYRIRRFFFRVVIGFTFLSAGGYLTIAGADILASGNEMNLGIAILGFGISVISYSVLILILVLGAQPLRFTPKNSFNQ